MKAILIFAILFFGAQGDPELEPERPEPEPEIWCKLPDALVNEIHGYRTIAERISNEILNGPWHHRAYDHLGYWVDTFGPRHAGSEGLEPAIDYVFNKMKEDLGDSGRVYKEKVDAVGWIVGDSELRLTEPVERLLKSMNIGGCGNTTDEGMEGEFVVARNFEELEELRSEVAGRILVYNNVYFNYSEARQYRHRGIFEAVKMNAIGVIVRSTTPFSLNSIHNGHIPEGYYEEGLGRIPSLTITIEDAEFLQRVNDRSLKDGTRPKLFMKVVGDQYPNIVTHNLFGELTGRESPDEIVIVSAHIDSPNMGPKTPDDGSIDDGGGVFIGVEAVALLKHLGLIPRRSLQAVFWTGEEIGLIGVQAFMEEHRHEMDKYIAAFESDMGVFNPIGLDFAGSDDASCIVKEILQLMEGIQFQRFKRVSTDISFLQEEGVPGFEIRTKFENYFWYHHSEADRFNVMDPDMMDSCLAIWATTCFIISDLSIPLPRNSSNWIISEPGVSVASNLNGNLYKISFALFLALIINYFYYKTI